MNSTPGGVESGYSLERIFANDLQFTGHPVADDMPEIEAPMQFGWDWTVDSPESFSVRVTLSVLPTKARPETTAVTLTAGFSRRGEPTVPLVDFASKHAPAIMMPFVREIIFSLSGRGLHGGLLLPPFNVLAMMSNLDVNESEGMKQLRGDSELAKLLDSRAADGG